MMHETKGGNEGRQGEEDYYIKQNLYPSYIPLCCHVCFLCQLQYMSIGNVDYNVK